MPSNNPTSRIEVCGNFARVYLLNGEIAIIDREDVKYVKNQPWHRHSQGYASRFITESRSMVLLHRLLMDAKPGDTVHFISADRLDCRKRNLVLRRKGAPIRVAA